MIWISKYTTDTVALIVFQMLLTRNKITLMKYCISTMLMCIEFINANSPFLSNGHIGTNISNLIYHAYQVVHICAIKLFVIRKKFKLVNILRLQYIIA